MIMKSVHKRMDNTSLPVLCGIVVITIVACIVVSVHKVVAMFKS